jgi:hypothetical protein
LVESESLLVSLGLDVVQQSTTVNLLQVHLTCNTEGFGAKSALQLFAIQT